jgi:putative Mn2+ efflux pump MntP
MRKVLSEHLRGWTESNIAVQRFKMDIPTIVLIAFSLAMDAFAVSVTSGTAVTHQRRRRALTMASFFGGFQMLMPVIGWTAGLGVKELIVGVDHWIAFGLLAIIGFKMIYDSAKRKMGEKKDQLGIHILLALSIATSIDAFVVGLSFAFLQTYIAAPIILIGIVTYSLSLTGFFLGNTVGQLLGNKVKAIGGLILIGIGIKILLEHLS